MQIDSYRDAVALVTGAASGFGRLLAQRLSRSGARLVLGDINEPALREVEASLLKVNQRTRALRCDVRSEEDAAALVSLAVQEYGRLDVAFNNAGILGKPKLLIHMDAQQFDELYAVNARGVFLGLKHQIQQMLKQAEGGRILNVSSILGVGGAPGAAAYAASKHAVIGLTKTAAIEYGGRNIRINAVCPFISETPMLRALTDHDPQAGRVMAATSPMRRPAAAEEIVNVMMMICAAENSFMNGQAIVVDGGMTAA